jgi:hypothetical protein
MKNLWFLVFSLLSVGAMVWMFIMDRRARAQARTESFRSQSPGAIQTRDTLPTAPVKPKPAPQPARHPGDSTGMFKR